MCLSYLGQIAFGAVMFLALLLTCISVFTPGWRSFQSGNKTEILKNFTWPTFGLIDFVCDPKDLVFPHQQQQQNSSSDNADDLLNNNSSSNSTGTDACKQWWEKRPKWERAVIACMGLSLLLELTSLIWLGISFCACCCRKYIVHPLPLFALMAALFLAVALVIYGIKNKDAIEHIPQSLNDLKGEATLSYSFYVGCGAFVSAIAGVIIGLLVVHFVDNEM